MNGFTRLPELRVLTSDNSTRHHDKSNNYSFTSSTSGPFPSPTSPQTPPSAHPPPVSPLLLPASPASSSDSPTRLAVPAPFTRDVVSGSHGSGNSSIHPSNHHNFQFGPSFVGSGPPAPPPGQQPRFGPAGFSPMGQQRQFDPSGSPFAGSPMNSRLGARVPSDSVNHVRHASSTSSCSEPPPGLHHGIPGVLSSQFMEGMVRTVLSQHADSFHPQVILVR